MAMKSNAAEAALVDAGGDHGGAVVVGSGTGVATAAAGSLDVVRNYVGVNFTPKARRMSGTLLSFIALVILPSLLTLAYTTLIAADRYTAEFRVSVRTVDPAKSAGLPALLGLSGMSQSSNDSHAIVQYVKSRGMVEELDKAVSLRSLYDNSDIDWWSRLKKGASIEKFELYWKNMIEAYFETSSSTIIVKTTAFTPEASLAVAKSTLGFSESLVNRMSERLRTDMVAVSQREVEKAEQRLRATNERLRQLRDSERILDPRKSGEATLMLASKLREEITKLSAELSVQRSYMSDQAPSVTATRQRLAGMQKELDRVNSEGTQTPLTEGRSLSSVVGAFDQLENERVFAQNAYQTAQASLATSVVEASRQQVYLTTIVRPELPQTASFPQPLQNTAMIFGVMFAIWTVVVLVFAGVREHWN